jgi:hypothetical protein
MKTNGRLQYEYELLPELEPISDYQTFDLEFAESDLNFMVFAKLVVDVSVEHDGDDWNTPRTTTIKSKIHSLEVDICDENGDEVEDENYLIYDEVLYILQNFYEK